MPGVSDTGLFQESLGRAGADPRFLDVFYDRFIAVSPEIARVFEKTDMERLKRKLKSTLHIVTLAVDQAPGAELYLEYLGKVHGRLDIRPEFYALWLESLVQTARECDLRFSPELDGVWRRVVGYAIAAMGPAGPGNGKRETGNA